MPIKKKFYICSVQVTKNTKQRKLPTTALGLFLSPNVNDIRLQNPVMLL